MEQIDSGQRGGGGGGSYGRKKGKGVVKEHV